MCNPGQPVLWDMEAEEGIAMGKVLAETQGTESIPELSLRMGEGTRLREEREVLRVERHFPE